MSCRTWIIIWMHMIHAINIFMKQSFLQRAKVLENSVSTSIFICEQTADEIHEHKKWCFIVLQRKYWYKIGHFSAVFYFFNFYWIHFFFFFFSFYRDFLVIITFWKTRCILCVMRLIIIFRVFNNILIICCNWNNS